MSAALVLAIAVLAGVMYWQNSADSAVFSAVIEDNDASEAVRVSSPAGTPVEYEKPVEAPEQVVPALPKAAITGPVEVAAPPKADGAGENFIPTIDDYGSAPGVAADSSPAAAAVALAARSGEHSERLSAMMQPPAITRERWAQQRAEILSTTAPGRVWQVARGGENVPYTGYLGENDIEVVQGQTRVLTFKSAPNAPLNLYSNGLGAFAQGLTSITVETDAAGLASVPWTAIPGTFGAVTVIASSPFAQGMSEVAIEVTLPAGSDAVNLPPAESPSTSRSGAP